MTDSIPVPQPPLTPEQISAGKDVEIRRLTAQIDTLTTVSQQYVDELATARARVRELEQERTDYGLTLTDTELDDKEYVRGYIEDFGVDYHRELTRRVQVETQFAALTQAHQQLEQEHVALQLEVARLTVLPLVKEELRGEHGPARNV